MAMSLSDRLFGSMDELDLVRRFANALHLAIYDKKLENQAEVVYYYDADVVTSMILGFQQFKYATKAPDQQRSGRLLFVRSLLSVGYMGPLSILRSHALELDDVLGRKPAFRSNQLRDDFSAELKEFLADWGVSDHFNRLHRVISDISEPKRVNRFLQELQEIGPEAFIPIELASGSWQQRLIRFSRDGLLHFDELGDSVTQILRDPALEQLSVLITQERSRERGNHHKQLSLSNFRDAMSLTALYRLIRRREQDPMSPYVRFYTETDVLHRAWRNSEAIRGMLSYKTTGTLESWESSPDFVGRTPDYFVIRALFEELRFPSVKALERPIVMLSALEEVDEELAELPVESEKVRELLSRPQKLNGQSLGDHLKLFGSLSFIRSIWSRYRPPVMLTRYIQGFDEVWAFAQEGASAENVRRRVSDELGQVQKKLHAHVEDLRSWFSLFSVIQNSSRNILTGHNDYWIPPNPMRDLGLVRWGMELSDQAAIRFRGLAAPLIAKDQSEWWTGCADLTSAIRDLGTDQAECATICAILWWLNEFSSIEQVLNQFEINSKKPLPIWAYILRAAARLWGPGLNCEKKLEMVEVLRDKIRALPDSQRSQYLIGIGYVLFHTWRSENEKQVRQEHGGTDGGRELLRGWIEESFEVGEEAYRGLQRGSLAWAFAINHCAYVGSVANIEPIKTAYCLAQLGSLVANGAVWNYRFVDTLAYSFYLDAERLWQSRENFSLESELDYLRQQVWRNLDRAYKIYAQARIHFGDQEIPAHINNIDQLARQSGYSK